jgi:hypothetical protein
MSGRKAMASLENLFWRRRWQPARNAAARLERPDVRIARIICERLGPQYTSRLRKLAVETTI